MLELEDGVALSSKPAARTNAVNWLNGRQSLNHTLKCQELGLRVNSVSSGLIEEDVNVSCICLCLILILLYHVNL